MLLKNNAFINDMEKNYKRTYFRSTLSGSVEDNISFFDEEIDRNKMIACAKIAVIHDDIEAMSMGYNTLIAEMGSSLSGGQIQRILLARALYHSLKFYCWMRRQPTWILSWKSK